VRAGGPADEALDRLALRDAVRVTGPLPQEELVGLFQRAAVVAVPSLYEGFSLPAVEAMACATAVVTTDAGALPEVVGDEAGLRVRAGDVGELSAALGRVLDDPALAARLGAAGRQRVLRHYTWRATAERTADWYQAVLARTGRPC
jgi:glycosyltransferase involved in cell wall biosynthesis